MQRNPFSTGDVDELWVVCKKLFWLIDELLILRYLGGNESFWHMFDGFITKGRLQTTQDCKLKNFDERKKKVK